MNGMKKCVFVVLLVFVGFSANGQCDSLNMTLTGSNPICHDFSDGSISVSVSGANGIPTITTTDISGTIVSYSPTINSLIGGWYYVEVVDDSSCVAIDSIFLVNPPEMDALITYTDPTHIDSCNGIAEVDTVLNYQGNYANIGYYWNPGGPSGIGETIKDDLCNDFYSVTINDEWGCSIVVDFASGSATTHENGQIESIIVYPNPVVDQLFVTGNLSDGTKVLIYTTTGQLVSNVELEANKIDISDLKSGQYIVKIVSNGSVHSPQIIKN